MAEIRIEHVFKRFGKVTAVNDFDLVVNDGEFVSILGPSGCGKTTTLRMIAGFERATEGEIFIGDHMVSSSKEDTFVPPEKRNIGMVFQSYAVWPHMNVFDNVAYPLKVQKVPTAKRKERVLHALSLVHLDEYAERLPSQLSGGQQQRVALARALVAEPSLLLLDEPLSNLDAKLRESMRFEILQLQKELAITVVYVTHDQGEAMAMSDKVVVMDKGIIQQIGAPYEIYTQPANKMVADFIGLVNLMQGTVKDGRVYINDIEGSFATAERISGSATIAVRPENITMNKNKGLITGKITSHFYLGDSVDYRVLVGTYEMRVITKGSDIKSFVDGDTVFLDFEDVLVFENNDL